MSTIPEQPSGPQSLSLSRSFRSVTHSPLSVRKAALRPVVAAIAVCALALGMSIFHPVGLQPATAHGLLTQVVAPASSCSGLMTGC